MRECTEGGGRAVESETHALEDRKVGEHRLTKWQRVGDHRLTGSAARPITWQSLLPYKPGVPAFSAGHALTRSHGTTCADNGWWRYHPLRIVRFLSVVGAKHSAPCGHEQHAFSWICSLWAQSTKSDSPSPWLVSAKKNPSTHVSHATLPIMVVDLVLEHATQNALEKFDAYLPIGHFSQNGAPARSAKRPGLHCSQDNMSTDVCIPSPHAAHEVRSSDGNVPGSHRRQSVCSSWRSAASVGGGSTSSSGPR